MGSISESASAFPGSPVPASSWPASLRAVRCGDAASRALPLRPATWSSSLGGEGAAGAGVSGLEMVSNAALGRCPLSERPPLNVRISATQAEASKPSKSPAFSWAMSLTEFGPVAIRPQMRRDPT